MSQPEILKCPQCLDEVLIRQVGRIAVCPECDLYMIVPIEEPEPEAA